MAAKKRPQKSLATPWQSDLLNKANLTEELRSYKSYSKKLQLELEKINAEFEEKQGEIEKKQGELEEKQAEIKKRSESESILQKTIKFLTGERNSLGESCDSLKKSRDSLRGKLANMTAQRNRLLKAQKRNIEKLLEIKVQLDQIQEDFNQDMAELADAYKHTPLESRHLLPQKLKDLLDKIEEDYIDEKKV